MTDIVSVKGIVTGTLNVRKNPNGNILGTLENGVQVNGDVHVIYPNWIRINFKGQEGYVYKMYVK